MYSAKFVKAMESNHKKERENDKARIASLEQYIETIHAEFAKNKQFTQMLVNKIEND